MTMPNALTLTDLTAHERRWLVNVFAALSGHIEDELEYEDIDHHVPDLHTTDPERFALLWDFIKHELRQCMLRLDAQEVARLDAELAAYRAAHPFLNVTD
jgi:hypothetical protein